MAAEIMAGMHDENHWSGPERRRQIQHRRAKSFWSREESIAPQADVK